MGSYVLPATKARSRFLSMVKDAGGSFSRYVITHRGKPEAVMMGFDEFEGWLETLEITQSPSWKRALALAKREDRAGRRIRYEDAVGKKPKS